MKLFITLCILWLVPFIITSFFNHPAIDDYWNANVVEANGKLGAVNYFYQTVSARYFSNFIMSFCNTLPTGKVWIFKVWPIITILLLFISFSFFYHSIFNKKASVTQIVSLSFLFVVLHISNMRSLFEGLYWMSSTICYQLAICFFVINIGAIIRDIKDPKLTTKILAIISCLALPGTVEIIIPIYIITLLLILYISIKLHYKKSIIIYCLGLSLVILVFIISSKGNILRVRNDSLTYNQHLLNAIFYSSRSVIYYTVIWLLNPINVAALILVGLSKKTFFETSPVIIKKGETIIFYVYSILLSIAVYLPLNLFESSTPLPRVTTLFFFLFFHICLVICWYYPSFNFSLINRIKRYFHVKYIRLAFFVFCFLCAFTTKNFVLVCKDLYNGTTMKYNQEAFQRYNLIRSCKTDTCFVPVHKNWPYFAQSTEKETSDQNPFLHMNVYFKKTILFR